MSSSNEQTKLTLRLAGIGAFSFWFPDLVIHVLARMYAAVNQAWYIMFALPVTFAIAYFVARGAAEIKGFRHAGVAMFLGVWCTGGLFIMFEWSVVGGPPWPDGMQNVMMWAIMCLFPPVTAFMSAYDGSLPGLVLLTIGAPLFWGFRAGATHIHFRRSSR